MTDEEKIELESIELDVTELDDSELEEVGGGTQVGCSDTNMLCGPDIR